MFSVDRPSDHMNPSLLSLAIHTKPWLPVELWLDILSWLSYHDLLNVGCVSRVFQALLADPTLADRLFRGSVKLERVAQHIKRKTRFAIHPVLDRLCWRMPSEAKSVKVGYCDESPKLSQLDARKEMATRPSVAELTLRKAFSFSSASELKDRVLHRPNGVTVWDVAKAMCEMLSTNIPGFYCKTCHVWVCMTELEEHLQSDTVAAWRELLHLGWDVNVDDVELDSDDYEAGILPYDLAFNSGPIMILYSSFSVEVHDGKVNLSFMT